MTTNHSSKLNTGIPLLFSLFFLISQNLLFAGKGKSLEDSYLRFNPGGLPMFIDTSECSPGMSAYLKLDDGSGSAASDEMGIHGGTLVNSPAWSSGQVGDALDFNGTSQYLIMADHADFDWPADASFTIELWANFTNVSNRNKVMIGRDDANVTHWWLGAEQNTGYALSYVLEGSSYGGESLKSTTAINDGQWHHLVLVRKEGNNTLYLYIDGVVEDSAVYDYTIGFSASTTLGVGYMAYHGNPDFYYDGKLDEVAIHNSALGAATVLEHYNNGLLGLGYCEQSLPVAPGSLSPTVISSSQIDLSWVDNSDNEDGFVIERSLTSGTGFTAIDTVTAGTSQYSDMGLTANTTYYYRVKAYNSYGESGYSAESLATTLTGSIGSCPSGIIAYLKLDETSGSTASDEIGTHTGTLANSPTWTGGQVGNALIFNGTDQYMALADHPELDWGHDADFSVELWANFTNVDSRNRVMIGRDDASTTHWWLGAEQNTGYAVSYVTEGSSHNGESVKSTTAINDGQWHHLVLVRQESNNAIYLYIDGVAEDSAVYDYTMGFLASTTLGIGYMAFHGTPDFYYDGTLDEIAIYNTALDASTIFQHYNNGINSLGYCEQAGTPPDIPGSLNSTAVSMTRIDLSWADNSDNEEGFIVERSMTSGSGYSVIDSVPAGITQYEDNGLTANTTYYYRVKSYNSYGESGYTTETSAATFAPSPSECPTGMDAYFKFDDGTGSTASDEIGTHIGNLVNGPTWTSGQVDGALDFDGTSQYMTVADHPDFGWSYDADFTVELWANFTNVSSKNKVMVGRDETNTAHWWIGAEQGIGQILGYVLEGSTYNGESVKSQSVLNDGQWHHLALVRQESNDMLYLYVDGVAEDSAVYDYSTGFAMSTPLAIGYLATNSTPNYFYDGKLDEVAVYNEALDRATISQHYNNGVNGLGYCESSGIPNTPTGLTLIGQNIGETQIGWTDQSYNEAGFVVLRKLIEEPTYEILDTTNANSISYLDNTVGTGLAYYYKIYAFNESGNSGFSDSLLVQTLPTVPESPTNLSTGEVTTTTAEIIWEDASANEQGFVILRSDDTLTGYQEVDSVEVGDQYYLDIGLEPATTYYYKIYAYNTGGNSDTTTSLEVNTLSGVPNTPQSLSIESVTSSSVLINWVDASDDENGFVILRSSSGEFQAIDTVTLNTQSYNDQNLTAGISYFYKLFAYNDFGNSDTTTVIEATTTPSAPDSPESLSVGNLSNSSINLHWEDKSTNELGFIIWRSLASGTGFHIIDTAQSNSTSYVSSGLELSTTYYYKICSYNSGGNSAFSNEVTGTTLDGSGCSGNMITYLRLDEGSGNISYDSRNGHDAVVTGTADWVTGLVNSAISFDGKTQYMDIPAHEDFNWAQEDNFTICLWTRFTFIDGKNKVMLGRDQGGGYPHWWIGAEAGTGNAALVVQDEAGEGDMIVGYTPINDGNWHFLVGVKSGNDVKLYVDGIFQGMFSHTFTAGFASESDIGIGYMNHNGSPGYYFNGELDEIAIYNTTLSEEEIIENFNKIQNGQPYCPNVVYAPVITSVAPLNAGQNLEYSYNVQANGYPAPTYTLLIKPDGMIINPNTGLIEWTPGTNNLGSYSVIIKAENSEGFDTQDYTLEVSTDIECPGEIIAYWPLEMINSSKAEDLYDNHDAKITGEIEAFQPGKVGNAAEFNDTSYLTVPGSSDFDWEIGHSFTIEFWTRFTGTGEENRVMIGRNQDGGTHWWIGAEESSGKIKMTLLDEQGEGILSLLSTSAVNDNTWHHITAIRNAASNTVSLYIDGVMENSEAFSFSSGFAAQSPLCIGYLNMDNGYHFDGELDEIALFKKAFSDAEVTYHYSKSNLSNSYCYRVNEAPVIVSDAPEIAVSNVEYKYAVNVNAYPPATFSLTTAPSGMTIGPLTGEISWTPPANLVGSSTAVQIQASNSMGTTYQTFNLNVVELNSCPSSLVSYYRFKEKTGESIGDEINNYVASLKNNPAHIYGIEGMALDFNGIDQGMVIPANTSYDWDVDEDFTIEFWANFINASSPNRVIIGRDDGEILHWWVGVESGFGKASFTLMEENHEGAILESTGSINDGEWHHIAAVRKGSSDSLYLYVDGIKEASAYYNYSIGFESSSDINIGFLNISGRDGYFFDGKLDELAIHNIALNNSDISMHYILGLSGDGYCPRPPEAPVINTTEIPEAVADLKYTFQISASGYPEPTYSLTNEPSGMSIDDAGYITWDKPTINDVGTSQFTITATNVQGQNSVTLDLITLSEMICPEQMVSYWTIDGQYPLFDDYATNHLSGLGSCTIVDTGLIENSILISRAENNYLTLDDAENINWGPTASFSISLWAKIGSTGSGNSVIIGNDDPDSHWWIGHNAQGIPVFILAEKINSVKVGPEELLGSASISNDSEWHHIVGVRDAEKEMNYLYVDGVLDTAVTYSYTKGFGMSTEIGIGYMDISTPSYFYDGMVDEIAIYNKALSQDEVLFQYNKIFNEGKHYCNIEYFPPIISSVPNQYAIPGFSYWYAVMSEARPLPTYSLAQAPDGLLIDPSTGVMYNRSQLTLGSHIVQIEASNGESPDAIQQYTLNVVNSIPANVNLTHYFRMDEYKGGTAIDDVNNLNGTINGSPNWTPQGVADGAIEFNGLNNYITVPDSATLDWPADASFSFGLWVRSDNSEMNGNQVLIGRHEEGREHWWLGIESQTAYPMFVLTENDYEGPIIKGEKALNDNIWHYLFVTRDGSSSTTSLYMDGELLVDTVYTYSSGFASSSDLGIGYMDITKPGYFFKGQMDEVAIYNNVLTQEEMYQSMYNASFCGGYYGNPYRAPIIYSEPTKKALLGKVYQYNAEASGDPVSTYSLSANAPGMIIDSENGEINWTPQAIGTYNVTITAANSQGSNSQEYVLEVLEDCECPATIISSYPLDNSADDSYGGHTMITNGSPTWTTGNSGGALSFNGADQYASIEDNDIFDWSKDASFSIELWVNFNEIEGSNKVMIGRDDQNTGVHWWLGADNKTGQPVFTLLDASAQGVILQGSYPINTSEWHHLVAVRDGDADVVKFYVDGNLESSSYFDYISGFGSSSPIDVANLFLDGNRGYYFNGSLDEIAIYVTALSADDIKLHYTQGISNEPNCILPDGSPVFISKPDTIARIFTNYSPKVKAIGNPEPTYRLVDGPEGMKINAVSGQLKWMPKSMVVDTVIIEAKNSKGTDLLTFEIISGPIRVMPLGNSITFDNNTFDMDEITRRDTADRISYRKKLYELLTGAGYNFDFVGSELAGQNQFPDADNAGFPGRRDEHLAEMFKSGLDPYNNTYVSDGPYLDFYPADVLLLHVGTNDLGAGNVNITGLVELLEEIDDWEERTGNHITVILAKIINRRGDGCTNHSNTVAFNNILEIMAKNRIANGDDIILVDMMCGAGIDYQTDMADDLHPNNAGYEKMAAVWYEALDSLFTAREEYEVPPDLTPYITSTNKNSVMTMVFDENENVVAQSISYSNSLGKPIQSISRNMSEENVTATMTLYDAYGRGVISTLPAVVDQQNLDYIENFITNSNGYSYDYLDFDGANLNNPDIVNPNSHLGNYYSDYNEFEEYVPTTNYPYTRVEYSQIQPGAARRSTLAGDAHSMGQGHEIESYSMQVPDDEFHDFANTSFNISGTEVNLDFKGLVKTISVDPDKKISVTYVNADGNVVAACLGNGGTVYEVSANLKQDEFLDFHVPEGCGDRLYLEFETGETYELYNLANDAYIGTYTNSGSQYVTIAPGFYRIVLTYSGKAAGEYSTIKYDINYDEHSFNFYDKTGQLKYSLSPKGYEDWENSTKTFEDFRLLASEYHYNSLGWLLYSSEPDIEHNLTDRNTYFNYRKDGAIRFSQNPQQRENGVFSYTNYDDLGRVVESGECEESASGIEFRDHTQASISGTTLDILEATFSKEEFGSNGISNIPPYCHFQAYYLYDEPAPDWNLTDSYPQNFTTGAVSKSWNAYATAWYSYTYDGKIEWVAKQMDSLDMDKDGLDDILITEYEYDFNGNVTSVTYQKGMWDEFNHTYTYDYDKRLKSVKTTDNTGLEKLQAKYRYYNHGALKRTELGGNLQGIDYVYTINGWLKSINHPSLDAAKDPGKDGDGSNPSFAPDAFGMSLDYHTNDYSRSGTNIYTTTISSNYNGNIAAQRWNTSGLEDENCTLAPSYQWGYQYSYDKHNWLKRGSFGQTDGMNGWNFVTDRYGVSGLEYDLNGNIQTLNRFDGNTDPMDNLTYHYYNNTNKLEYVDDIYGSTFGSDISDQSSGNNVYNNIGQLVSNVADGHYFDYDVYGKVTAIYSDAAKTTPKVFYYYDENGYRVAKEDVESGKTTWYVRDNGGSILSIYTDDNDNGDILPEEFPIYASSRIGTALADDAGNTSDYVYEITDHLGNVRATLGDDYYTSGTLLSYADYYPMGMVIPGREKVASHEYRFGYQGQFAEKDGETGYNQFEARLYDSRIGRWMVFDQAGQYYSPYLGMGNNWVNSIDPNGMTSLTRIIFADGTHFDINDGSNAVFRAEGFTYTFLGYGYGGYDGSFSFQIPSVFGDITAENIGRDYIDRGTLNSFASFFGLSKYSIAGVSDYVENVDLTRDISQGNGMENWHPGFDLYMIWKTLSIEAAKGGLEALKIAPINLTSSSGSLKKSVVYTIYDGSGQLYKFGVSDAKLVRYGRSLLEAGPGATGKVSSEMYKGKAHMLEKYLRSLHYNSTGQYSLPGMKYPFPRNLNTGEIIH